MKTIFLTFLACFICICGQAADKVSYTEADRVVFDRYVSEMNANKALPFCELMVKTARFFLGTPYLALILEMEP